MPSERNPARIVLILSHALLRSALKEDLGRNPAYLMVGDVATVADGDTLLRSGKPDLAIVDWLLPDGRGVDLVRSLGPKLPRTRWLLLSSHEQGHISREAVSLGIQGLVMKSSSPIEILHEAVRRVLAGEKYYCPASSRLLLDKLSDESQALKTGLTARERDVLVGVARGESVRLVADHLGVSPKTIQNHITLLKDKLGLGETAELVHYALKHGYI